MKMPAFLQFSQTHIKFKILEAVCVCVCACARVHVCVFDKKRVGTHFHISWKASSGHALDVPNCQPWDIKLSTSMP